MTVVVARQEVQLPNFGGFRARMVPTNTQKAAVHAERVRRRPERSEWHRSHFLSSPSGLLYHEKRLDSCIENSKIMEY